MIKMRFEIIDNIETPETVQRIWEKGLAVEGYNPDLYRKDHAGAWIARFAYHDRKSLLGWEVDHVYPLSKGGDNHFDNLRPINWKNNLSKGDEYPSYIANVISEDNRNIERPTPRTVNLSLQELLKTIYNF